MVGTVKYVPNLECVLEKFAAPELRTNRNGLGQRDTMRDVIEQFDDGADVVYLQSPTGTGKSLMLMAIANSFDSAFYTTPQIMLVDQIENDHFLKHKCKVIKGRSNYPCIHREGLNHTCNKAPCATRNNFDCEFKESLECPYYSAKEQALHAQTAMMSFMYFQIENMYGGKFDARDILVIDEAHTIESWVLNLISVTVKADELPDGYTFEQIESCRHADDLTEFLHGLFHEYERKAIELTELPFRTPETQAYLDALNGIMGRISKFIKDVEGGNKWVFELSKDKLFLQPVTIGRFMDKYVYSRASKFLLASGTILDKFIYGQCIGLQRGGLSGISLFDKCSNMGEYKTSMVDVPTPFPLGNNVIIDASIGKMTRDNVDKIFDETLHRIEKIIDEHDGDKGLVHCHSYALMNRFMDNIDKKYEDRAICHSSDDRKTSIDRWLKTFSSDAKVFFSVNMTEGLNLPDSQCRFQILAKAAFPYLGDKRIAARMNMPMGRRWYNLIALQQLIQSNGRAIRSKEDYANYYIMDKSAIALINRSYAIIPDWFGKIFNMRGEWVDYPGRGAGEWDIEYKPEYPLSMWDKAGL